jgi:hypothetical protein
MENPGVMMQAETARAGTSPAWWRVDRTVGIQQVLRMVGFFGGIFGIAAFVGVIAGIHGVLVRSAAGWICPSMPCNGIRV